MATMAKSNQAQKETTENTVPIAISAAKERVKVDSDARLYAINPVKAMALIIQVNTSTVHLYIC